MEFCIRDKTPLTILNRLIQYVKHWMYHGVNDTSISTVSTKWNIKIFKLIHMYVD